MSVTFSTCWYIFKAKFVPSVYKQWIHNMLSNVHNYNLVVYCDETSYPYIEPYVENPRIRAVLKPVHEFSTYHLRDKWILNHRDNRLLNDKVEWQLNMLWSEKLHFVQQTIQNQYFESCWYGWCDIGYFRGRPNDLSSADLVDWPSPLKMAELDQTKIYYACVNNHPTYVNQLYKLVVLKNSAGLPHIPIPDGQVSIAGGFFLGTRENLEWWHTTYYRLLNLYFDNGRLVKDDQIIVANGVFSNVDRFAICTEADPRYDNWFMFQRYLLS